MQIMKIDPDEKCVLLFPEIDDHEKMMEMANDLGNFLVNDMTCFFIYGERVAIVPAKQVVGYKTIKTK